MNARPELIFVRGPQEGERAILMTNVVLVGRAPNADVRLAESAASREQVQFTLMPEGWVMENLSANGTLVNGKRFKKRKKKLLLETGDVLGAGVDTEIVYVAPGDDPEQALMAYRAAHPARPAEAPPAGAPGAGPAARPGAAPPAEAKAKAVGAPEAAVEEASEGEEIEEVKGKKTKVVLGGVVLVGMVLFGLAMVLKSVSDEGLFSSSPGGLPRLTDLEITEALAAPLERSPSPVKAAIELDKAVHMFTNSALWEPGDLFRCAKHFKLYKAYKQTQAFESIQHERMAEQVEKDLDKLVREKYDAAWKFEKARDWRNAKAAFGELMIILPVAELDRGGFVCTVIQSNVILHLNYIKSNMGRVD